MQKLKIEPLSRTAFAPFGNVIEPEAAARTFEINEGTARRFHDVARVETVGAGAHAMISLCRAQPRALPVVISMLERHPLGSQAFVPLSPEVRYVVVVAVDPNAPRAFLVQGQGVNYHRGTWHHPLIALEQVSDFLIVDREGEGDNCEEIALAQQWLL